MTFALATAVLPLCDSSNVGYCVESLEMSASGSPLVKPTYLGEAPGSKFPAQSKYDLPAGGGPLVFRASEVTHAGGGDTYAVIASYVLQCSHPSFKCTYNSFYLAVQPFTNNLNPLDYKFGERFDFLDGTRVKVSLQIPNDAANWFSGRLHNPNLEVSPLQAKSGFSKLTLDAQSLSINRLSVNVPSTITTPQMAALNMTPDLNAGIESGFDTAVSWVEELRPFANDTATGQINVWQLKSIRVPNQQCYQTGQINGLVTTNAVGYSWNPPDFENGYLNYKVAGMHFNKDKTVAIGTYNLIMRSEVARCLYGFSSAPVSATVQVVGTDGSDDSIATSVTSEKDGWLKLAAYGFTFSEKEIRVKLTQPYSGTLTKFAGTTKTLSSRQKTEIKAAVSQSNSNPKFICTGTYVKPSDKAIALSRAKAVCNYAKGIDKNHSFFAQAKQTKAASYDGKVLISSK
jgi:hypothetical protein